MCSIPFSLFVIATERNSRESEDVANKLLFRNIMQLKYCSLKTKESSLLSCSRRVVGTANAPYQRAPTGVVVHRTAQRHTTRARSQQPP